MSACADEQSPTVSQKLGAHTYGIPRDILELIHKPDYSREPNPNPNWSREPVIRLAVQGPELTARRGGEQIEIEKRIENAKRQINISLLSLSAAPILGVNEVIRRRSELGLDPKIGPAKFGLRELRSTLAKGFQDYIATSDDGREYLIHCTGPDDTENTTSTYRCDSKFPYDDLYVQVNFSSIYLPDWQALHRRTISLINSMRRT